MQIKQMNNTDLYQSRTPRIIKTMENINNQKINREITSLEYKIDELYRTMEKCKFGGNTIVLVDEIGAIRDKYRNRVYLEEGSEFSERMVKANNKMHEAIRFANGCDCNVSDRRY